MKKSIILNKIITILLTIAFIIYPLLTILLVTPDEAFAQTDTTNKDPDNCPDNCGPSLYQTFNKDINKLAINAEAEKRVDLNSTDKGLLENYLKIAAYQKNNPDVSNSEAAKKVGVRLQDFDIRVLRSIIAETAPSKFGGGGGEHLKIDSIAKGYTSEKTKYNKIMADPGAPTTSAHYYGQAAETSQIDFLRYTQVVIGNNGEIQKKTKLKKTPVEVKWQDPNYKPSASSSGTNPLGLNPSQMFNGQQGGSLNNALSDATGKDYSKMDTTSRTLPQTVKSVGSFNINDIYGFSQNNDLAFSVNNLRTLGWETGGATLEQDFSNIIPKQGFSGSNTEEFLTNTGRSALEKNMGLAYGSLNGNDSNQIITKIGERKIENNLKLTDGSLVDIKSADDLQEKIGNGYLYKINLEPGTFSGTNYADTREKVGTEKMDGVFSEPNLVDNLLGTSQDTALKYKNGELTTQEFKKEIGKSIINQRILFYENSDSCRTIKDVKVCNARDEAFGIYNENYPAMIDRMLSGDNTVFKDIGYDTIEKLFSTDNDVRNSIGKWLSEKTIDTDENGIKKFDLDAIANKFGLTGNDLQSILINNLSDEIYQRVGHIYLLAAVNPEVYTSLTTYIPTIQTDDFYNQRLNEIKNIAQSLGSNSKIGSFAQQIVTETDKPLNFATDSTSVINTKSKQTINSAYKIIELISNARKISNKDELSQILYQTDEIITGTSLQKLSDFNADNISGLKEDNSIGLSNEEFAKVLQGKQSIDDLKLNIGLEAWSMTVFNSDDYGLLSTTLQEIIANKDKKPSDIITKNLTEDKINEVKDSLNSEFELSGNYAITSLDLTRFLNGDYILLFKIGGSVFDKTFNLRSGAIYDIFTGKSTWDNEQQKTSINNLWQIAGLGSSPSTYNNDDVIQRLKQNLFEQVMGLTQNAFYGSVNEAAGRVGIENLLSSFGISIPSNILSLKDVNPTQFTQQLQSFFSQQIQIPGSDYWKNLTDKDAMNAVLQLTGVNLSIDQIQDMFTGKKSIQEVVNNAGNVLLALGVNNDSINSLFQLSNYFSQGEALLNALKSNDIGSTLNILQSVTNTNLDSLAGGLPVIEILSNPKNAGQIMTQWGLNNFAKSLGIDNSIISAGTDLVNMFFKKGMTDDQRINQLAGMVQKYTGIPYIQDAVNLIRGDTSGLVAMGMTQINQQLGQLGINIDIGQIRNAFFDIAPGSSQWNQAYNTALKQVMSDKAYLAGDSTTKMGILYDYTSKEISRIKSQAMEQVQFGLMDGALGKAIGGNMSGFSQAMFKGSTDDKVMAGAMLLGRVSGNSKIVADATMAYQLAKYFSDPKNNKIPGAAFSYLDGAMSQALGINLPHGFSQAIMAATQGNTKQLEQLGTNMVIGQVAGFVDKSLGMPAGTAYSMYNAYNTYNTALNAYHSAIANNLSTGAQAAALQNLQMSGAGAVNMVVNMVFGGAMADMENSMGLPSGTLSLLTTAVIYSIMVPGLGFAALINLMAPQLIAFALSFLPGPLGGLLGGGGKTEIRISGCGYWPAFSDKYKGSDGLCPDEYVIKDKNDEKGVPAFLKKVADYNIKKMVKKLLVMPDKSRSGQYLSDTDRAGLLPTQIVVYNPETILDKESKPGNKVYQIALKQYKTYKQIDNIFASMDKGYKMGIGDTEKKFLVNVVYWGV